MMKWCDSFFFWLTMNCNRNFCIVLQVKSNHPRKAERLAFIWLPLSYPQISTYLSFLTVTHNQISESVIVIASKGRGQRGQGLMTFMMTLKLNILLWSEQKRFYQAYQMNSPALQSVCSLQMLLMDFGW